MPALIIDAILAINSDAKVDVEDNDVNKIKWLQGTSQISASDILAKQKELIAEYSPLICLYN